MKFKIPRSKAEIMAMSPEEQEQIGDFLGRLYAHDPKKFEQATGMTAQEFGAMFTELSKEADGIVPEPQLQMQDPQSMQQKPVPLLTEASSTYGKESKPAEGEVKRFKVDVRLGKKVPIAPEDNAEPGPFELIMKDGENGEEVIAHGTRAKEFLK